MLKSRYVEFRHVFYVFTKYALMYPHVKFELFHDGKLFASTSGNGKMLDAIVAMFGVRVGRALITLKGAALNERGSRHEHHGFISNPASLVYSSRKFMFMFVNGRSVRSELMQMAVKRGYGTSIPKNAYPFAVVALEMPPDLVNVNIHPRKEEVRFRDEKGIAEILTNSMKEALKNVDGSSTHG